MTESSTSDPTSVGSEPTSAELQKASAKLKALTPYDVIAMDRYFADSEKRIEQLELEIDALKEVIATVSEAIGPAHAWSHFQHEGTREEISLGVRGRTMEEVSEAFFAAVESVREKYHVVLTGSGPYDKEPKTSEQPAQPRVVQAGSAEPVYVPVPGEAPSAPSAPHAPASASQEKEDWQKGVVYEYVCNRVRITSPHEAGGTSRVELFGTVFKQGGDDFPLVTVSRKPENLVKIFERVWIVDADYFERNQDTLLRDHPILVRWQLSEDRMTRQNKPYKDLVSIEPVTKS